VYTVIPELVSPPISLKNREFTGKPRDFGLALEILLSYHAENAEFSTQFPKNLTGNLPSETYHQIYKTKC